MGMGPSKQELEMYWQNSRQYFDELARHYKQADPEYYKEFIQPFYSNPFRSTTPTVGTTTVGTYSDTGVYKSQKKKKPVVVLLAVSILLTSVAASLFLFLDDGFDSGSQRLKSVADTITTSQNIKTDDIKAPPVVEPVPEESPEKSIHFRRGEKLFELKNYKLAERYLKQVPKTDKNYPDAQRMLEIIKAGNTDKGNENSREKRVKPIQPVR